MFKSSSKLYCFSPPVMVGVFIIEVALGIYTLVRYKMSAITRLAASILFLLAIFQLSEFQVCGRSSTEAIIWSRVGYIAIALLPALALHVVFMIARKKSRMLLGLAYGTAVAFAVVFGSHAGAFTGHQCAGNYAIFQLVPPIGGLFFVYYYFWLAVGIGFSLYFSIKANVRTRQALILLVFGYLSFLLPTGIVNAIDPQTIAGIPSIMCGFAVIFALILSLTIVPTVLRKK